MNPIAQRVLARYVGAKVSLVPEFKKAVDAYEAGDPAPVLAFIESLQEVILPKGVPPQWFFAVSPAKQKAVKTLFHDGKRMVKLVTDASYPDQAKYRTYVADQLRIWGKNLRTVEIASVADEEEKSLKRGAFTIIPMPGVKKGEVEAALAALDGAIAKLKPRFPQVLYGKVFFGTTIHGKNAAVYMAHDDTVHINVRAKRDSTRVVFTLCHELAHRLDAKFMRSSDREEFWALSKAHPVSAYGATDPKENFADAVALSLFGKPIPEPLQAIIDRL